MYKKFEMLLERDHITPYRVYKDTGISTATLSDWKNGKSQPKKDKIEKAAKEKENQSGRINTDDAAIYGNKERV